MKTLTTICDLERQIHTQTDMSRSISIWTKLNSANKATNISSYHTQQPALYKTHLLVSQMVITQSSFFNFEHHVLRNN